MLKNILPLLLLAALFTGCASDNYQLHSVLRTEPLAPGSSVLVTVPANGRYASVEYTASGRQTARVVAAAFAKHVKRVDVQGDIGSLGNPTAVGDGRYDYKIIPQVVRWEDRNTQWSSQPDRIEIEVRTIRVSDGAVIALGSVVGKSSWHAVGAADPEDLLQSGIEPYIDWLFTDIGTPLPEVKSK